MVIYRLYCLMTYYMAKGKSSRINVTIECAECRNNSNKIGVSQYLTSKNKRTTSLILELLKYCKFCKKHTIHKELK